MGKANTVATQHNPGQKLNLYGVTSSMVPIVELDDYYLLTPSVIAWDHMVHIQPVQ